MRQLNGFDAIATRVAKLIIGNTRIDRVSSLDLSLPVYQVSRAKSKRKVYASIPAALSLLLPNLRELNLSNTHITPKALIDFSKRCPLLEKVTWHRNTSNVHLTGQDLDTAYNLKELYMDDSEFYLEGNQVFVDGVLKIENPSFYHMFILISCGENLERVSIRNAKYHTFMNPAGVDIPQTALAKFVVHNPSLRWFRSNLSQDTMAIVRKALLKAGRPEVELVN